MINTRDLKSSEYWQELADEYFGLYRRFYEKVKEHEKNGDFGTVVYRDPETGRICTCSQERVYKSIMIDMSLIASECRKKAELWRAKEEKVIP